MARQILRCSSHTAIAAMMGDLGWWSLRARRDIQRLRYWGNLVCMSPDRITRIVYATMKSDLERAPASSNNWCFYTKGLLQSLGLIEYWNKESLFPGKENWKCLIASKIAQREQNLWKKEVLSKGKLRTYRTIKTDLCLEPYLLHGGSLARSVLFSLRSGSNRLRIETGRWKKPYEEAEDRLCLLCKSNEVEDEVHFVASCEFYGDLRHKFFLKIFEATQGKVNLYNELDKHFIFELTTGAEMKSGPVWDKICLASLNFVYQAMKRRALTFGEKFVY